jgi:uncharacterized protein YidB (DUF937 family)
MRKIFSGFGGGGLGYAMGGVPGALAGAGLGTFVEQLASSGYTTKIQTARLMDQMAQALRAGDLTRAATYEAALKNAALQAQLGTAPPDPNTPTRVATPPPPR